MAIVLPRVYDRQFCISISAANITLSDQDKGDVSEIHYNSIKLLCFGEEVAI